MAASCMCPWDLSGSGEPVSPQAVSVFEQGGTPKTGQPLRASFPGHPSRCSPPPCLHRAARRVACMVDRLSFGAHAVLGPKCVPGSAPSTSRLRFICIFGCDVCYPQWQALKHISGARAELSKDALEREASPNHLKSLTPNAFAC